jgi:AraC family transcriptional regulator
MSLTVKALFVIERNLAQRLTLDGIASTCGVSRFHLAHAFAAATGQTVTDYIRARRLSEAARVLAQGAPNILDVAIASGYTSHEAFSRAFRTRLGTTPETVRKAGTLQGLELQEMLTMESRATPRPLAAPTLRSIGEQWFVGLAAERRMGDALKIPGQWQQFMSGPYHRIQYKLEQSPVGITLPGDTDEEFLYVCAAQVSRRCAIPQGLLEVTVPPVEYAIFAHDAHVSELPHTYRAIWNEWFATSGRQPKRAAALEHHNPTFDPRTGTGGVTVWIPLA